ncbi:flavodoxin domain-containing protein [uncultured Clostridium sp.]
MNNTVVVYKSKYGSTKKYAEWIAEELSSDIIENNKLSEVVK